MRRGLKLSMVLWVGLGATLAAQDAGEAVVTLRTRVVDETGKPIAGVGVALGTARSLRTEDALRDPVAISDAKGQIEFQAPALSMDTHYLKAMRYAMFAKAGYSTIRVTTNAPMGGVVWGSARAEQSSRPLGEIVMRPAGVLSGIVRGAGGRPLQGARVAVSEMLMAGSLKRYFAYGDNRQTCYSAADSDARGRFKLSGVYTDGMSLVVTAPGHYRKSLRFVAAGQPIDVTLEASGFVSGKVLDSEGRPVQAALYLSVEGHSEQLSAGKVSRHTRSDGSFRISIEARGRYKIQAIQQVRQGRASRSTASEIFSGAVSDVVLEMEAQSDPPLPIKVTVVAGDSKKPLAAGRAVVVWQQPAYLSLSVLEAAFANNAEPVKGGQVELPGPGEQDAPHGSVLVRVPGYAPRVVKGIEYDPDEPLVLEVEMSVGGTVEGSVVDQAGQALANAEVTIGRRTRRASYSWSPWSSSIAGRPLRPHSVTTRTDAQGKFRIENLADGYHDLYARVAGRPESERVHLKVSPDKRLYAARLIVPEGVTLTGRVYLPGAEEGTRKSAGLADKGFRVHLVPNGGAATVMMFGELGPFNQGPAAWFDGGRNSSPGASYGSALTGDGAFEFTGVAAGRYRFSLIAPALGKKGQPFSMPIEPLRVRGAPIQRDFDVSEDLCGIVRGKVTMPDAKLSMSRICVLSQPSANLNPATRLYFNVSWMRCMVEGDGSFEFHAGNGGHKLWLVDVVDGSVLYRHPELVSVEANQTVELGLQLRLALLRIRLHAEDPEAGFVASNLEWQFTHPGATRDQNFFRYNRYLGLSVEGRREFLMRVPVVPVDVAIHSGIALVDPGGGHQRHAIGEGSIVPVLGRLNTLDIRVSAPPEASGSPGK